MLYKTNIFVVFCFKLHISDYLIPKLVKLAQLQQNSCKKGYKNYFCFLDDNVILTKEKNS